MSFTTTIGAAVLAGGVLLGLPVGMASADPGLHVSVGGHDVVHVGDGSASSTKGNLAVGIGGGNAKVTTGGTGNVAIARGRSTSQVEGVSDLADAEIADGFDMGDGNTPLANRNVVITHHGTGVVYGGDDNVIYASDGGAAGVVNGSGNTINSSKQSLVTVFDGDNNTLAACDGGTVTIEAQSDQIKTSGTCS